MDGISARYTVDMEWSIAGRSLLGIDCNAAYRDTPPWVDACQVGGIFGAATYRAGTVFVRRKNAID